MALRGTPVYAGFYSTTQRPIEEAYLNNGQPWASEAEALENIPSGARYIGQLINIQNELYWFLDDLTTLTTVKDALKPKADEVLFNETDEEIQTLFAANNVEDALKELMNLIIKARNPFVIKLSAGAAISDKIQGAIIPAGWVLTDIDGTDLQITHNLEDREFASLTVKEINGGTKRLCIPFNEAFTGITENGQNITIEGLNPTDLAMNIYIFFS
jgi:hypothetical protein